MRLRKLFLGLLLTVSLVFTTISSSFAATYIGGNVVNNVLTKTPTNITLDDIARLTEIATEMTGKQASIVNAVRYNGSNTTWVVRLCFGNSYENAADYVLTVLPYSWDLTQAKVVSLPFKTTEEGRNIYGPSWYYFGLFDDVSHNICGFAIAERLRRWPSWADKTYSGTTKRGVTYSGTYEKEPSYSFIEDYLMAKNAANEQNNQ